MEEKAYNSVKDEEGDMGGRKNENRGGEEKEYFIFLLNLIFLCFLPFFFFCYLSI